MSAVERAAEVILSVDPDGYGSQLSRATALRTVQALVDAGWHDGPKLSDADRAVLDAADAYERGYADGVNAADAHRPADERSILEAVEAEYDCEQRYASWFTEVADAHKRTMSAVRARRETQP